MPVLSRESACRQSCYLEGNMQSSRSDLNPEKQRLEAARDERIRGRNGDPTLSERQWGTVREGLQ